MANTGTKREASPHEIPHSGWQPIETAPRDGTWIIAWDGRDVQPISWVDDMLHDEAASKRYTGWCFGDVLWGGVLYEGVHAVEREPTDWQPLPEPPRR